jgi:alpha-D-xyloside xylohydrolase
MAILTKNNVSTSIFKKDGNRLIFRYDAEKLWIEPWGENSLRVRSTKNATMPGTTGDDNEDWALLPQKPITPEITILDDSAVIKNGKIEIRVTWIGQILIYNDKGKLLLAEYVRNRELLLKNKFIIL